MSSSFTSTASRPEEFAHSDVHYAVATGDHAALSKIVSVLPKLADPLQVHNESDSVAQEIIADKISSVLDIRDNRNRETPLHLAVRLNDAFAVRTLSAAGADISLQNADGWDALQEAILRRLSKIIEILVQHQHLMSWSKWRRRLPRLIAGLRRMRDFYLEISFQFESSIVPFIGKVAPSDTYKIWKHRGNFRADTSFAGYNGLKIHRANRSFLFLGEGNQTLDIPPGSFLMLNHDKKKISDVFENAGSPLSEAQVKNICNQRSVYTPMIDLTKAELIRRTNWRWQEKIENVGEWRAKVYEVHNVFFGLQSLQITALDHDKDSEEGFLVAENPRQGERFSSFIREEREHVTVSRKSVDINPEVRRRPTQPFGSPIAVAQSPQTKKEILRSLRPIIWLTDKFPLKTEELLPLLDILANKVQAVRRMREFLTTTFPPGAFPVKLSIPVVSTVKATITITKFVELLSREDLYTSYPKNSSLSSSWLWRSFNQSSVTKQQSKCGGGNMPVTDPFAIPTGYVRSSFYDKNKRMKSSKSFVRSSK